MKTPEQTTAADYAEMGLRAGLEVHQQLDTATKLFCRCPATRYSPRFDATLLRHMRPTLSELGEYDPTALMEFKTRKEIIYRVDRHTVCTYEMDDAPPFTLNRRALDIALELALMLDCKLVDELHIARKQYLDGSIPTGFQRTTILGVGGSLRACGRRIGVRQLSLEEDSCREVSDRGHRRTYMTDRLSIPLIEVVTEPEMVTPDEVAAVGEVIRRLTRATGKVRTGAGAARQDVNVSVSGGTRVEIKGVPSIRLFRHLVHYEALRQRALLAIRRELRQRGLAADSFTAPAADVSALVRHTAALPIREALRDGGVVMGVRLPRFAGILRYRTGPSARFVDEIAGRVRVVACLDGSPNIYHDDDPELPVSPHLWERARTALEVESGDAVVLVWGPEVDVRLAASEIGDRAREALEGVPSETRQALPDGGTTFERLLPGPDRMYPDTDLPPIEITSEHVARIRSGMAPRPWDTAERLKSLGLNSELIRDVERSGRRALFDRLVARNDVSARVLAVLVGQQIRAAERRWARHLEDERLVELVALHAEGRFSCEAFPDILSRVGNDREVSVEEAVADVVPAVDSDWSWQDAARAALEGGPEWRDVVDLQARRRAAMGIVMGSGLRGRVPGAEVAQWLAKQPALTAAD